MNNLINSSSQSLSVGNFSNEYFQRWISFIDGSSRTVETYTKGVKVFADYLSDNGISEPTKETIIAYKKFLENSVSERTGKPLKATTIQNYLMAVKQFFNWLEEEELYKNISKYVKGEKLNRDHKKDYLSLDQVRELLATADRTTITGVRDYAILSLIVTSALRTVEVVRLTKADLKIVDGKPVLYILGKGKDEKVRITIAPEVDKAIRDYLKLRGTVTAEEPLFISHSNRSSTALTTKSVRRMIKDRLRTIGIDEETITAHSLRHTAITQAYKNGETDIVKLKQYARHSNIATTMIYIHEADSLENTCTNTVATALSLA